MREGQLAFECVEAAPPIRPDGHSRIGSSHGPGPSWS